MQIEERLVSICKELGGKAYAVGGCVRDELLGVTSKDKDFLVTGVDIEPLINALETVGKTNLVGKSFGIIKFHYNGVTYDVALPRKESYYGYGHTDVQVTYDKNLAIGVDLNRRDFTINAMAKDLISNTIIDPCGGQEDLKEKKLLTVGFKSFIEDPLRILRGIQFAARFGFTLYNMTEFLMKESAHLVRHVSDERVAMELVKLLRAPKPSVGFDLMRTVGVLKLLLPELHDLIAIPQPNKYHANDAYDHSKYVCDFIPWKKQVYLRVAGLLHDIGKAPTYKNENGEITFHGHQTVGAEMARSVLSRLKLHTVDGLYFPTDRILQLIKEHMFECNADSADKSILRFVRKLSKTGSMDQIRLRIGDRLGGKFDATTFQWVAFAKKIRRLATPKKSVFGLKALAINGSDLLAAGFTEGPQLGKVLKELLDVAFENPELNTKEALLEIAKEILLN